MIQWYRCKGGATVPKTVVERHLHYQEICRRGEPSAPELSADHPAANAAVDVNVGDNPVAMGNSDEVVAANDDDSEASALMPMLPLVSHEVDAIDVGDYPTAINDGLLLLMMIALTLYLY